MVEYCTCHLALIKNTILVLVKAKSRHRGIHNAVVGLCACDRYGLLAFSRDQEHSKWNFIVLR